MKRVLTVALLGLVVAACGSSSESSNTQTGMGFTAAELCSLVTPAQVGAALSRTVSAGVPEGVNAPSCTWNAADGAAATIAATDPASVGKLPFGLQGVSGAKVTPIPNLGDAAFFAAAGDVGPAELDLKKGGRAVTITAAYSQITQAEQEAAELAIAKAAVTHM